MPWRKLAPPVSCSVIVKAFAERGADVVGDRAFGENLVVEAWTSFPASGQKLYAGTVRLDDPDREGMPDHCTIYNKRMGECISRKGGVLPEC